MTQTKGFSNREVAHLWASQSQHKAEGSNLYFMGDTIYSYGSHFPIARILDSQVVLFTCRGYSATTATHKSYVRSAVSHMRVIIEVPNILHLSERDHRENIEYITRRISELIEKSSRARVHGNSYLSEAEETLDSLEAYLSTFQDKMDKRKKYYRDAVQLTNEGLPDVDGLRERLKEQAERERKQKARLQTEADKLLPGYVERWRQGEDLWRIRQDIPERLRPYLDGYGFDHMRIDGDSIETIRGARVKLDHALMLFRVLQAGLDPTGKHVGPYTVTGWTDGVLTIGCHKFRKEEINVIADQMDWGQL